MNRYLLVGFFSLMIASLGPNVQAGEKIGNGGGGWACRNQDVNSSLRWVKLLDLYEAQEEFGLRPVQIENGNFLEAASQILEARLAPIAPGFHARIRETLNRIFPLLSTVRADLEAIDDVAFRIRPRNQDCAGGSLAYAQIANYTTYGRILLNEELIGSELFSDTDMAALITHEAVYAYLRESYGDESSTRTRRIVGLLFSQASLSEVHRELEQLLGATLR